MKKYLFPLFALLIAASCNNAQKNKIEATDSQEVAAGNGQRLVVDITRSVIAWKGTKIGGFHEGTIKLKSGSLAIDNVNVASGSFVIDMGSIVCNDLTDASMNEMLVNHLKSADFFDVATYAESTFAITKVEAITPANDSITHTVSGNLKMKDVEKNITFSAKITKDADVYSAVSVPFTIDRTQWNVQFGSKTVFANLKDKIIDDNIQLQITIVAKPE